MADDHRTITVTIEYTPIGQAIISLARVLAEYTVDDVPPEVLERARDLIAVAQEHQEG